MDRFRRSKGLSTLGDGWSGMQIVVVCAPDVEERGRYGEGQRAEDDAGESEDDDAAEDCEKDGDSVLVEFGADEHGIEEVVDAADDKGSPGGKKSGLAPVAHEAEVQGDRDPDYAGAHDRKDCGDEGCGRP